MFNLNEVLNFFKEVANSLKFQVSAALTFGAALVLVWLKEDNELKIFLTILFLFPTCMFVSSIIEKIYLSISEKIRRNTAWKSLTPEERAFVSHYINENTKTRYVVAYNGTYRDSGIINPLIKKGVLYIASSMSEYRGESWMSAAQHFPINIHDKAYEYFITQYEAENKAHLEKE